MEKNQNPENERSHPESPVFDPESTLELLGRAHDGDAAALERLCRRYLPRLQRWASGRLPASSRGILETDDLVQEVLLRTVRQVERFEPGRSGQGVGFHAYVRQALTNRIRDEIRLSQRSPDRVELPEGLAQSGPSPIDAAIGREQLAWYENALERLKPEDRDAVIARVEMDMSYDEIAEALGKPSRNAARMAVVRALERLVRLMGNAEGDERKEEADP